MQPLPILGHTLGGPQTELQGCRLDGTQDQRLDQPIRVHPLGATELLFELPSRP
jgi:hypothetical protein